MFRGSPTSDKRIFAAEFADDYPEYLDIKITPEYYNHKEIRKGYINHRMNFVDQLQFKYIITIDGITSAWREPWLFFSGSVVLKMDSDFIDWYSPMLKPWVHYVPFKKDCSDLIERIKWLREHDQEARQISKNARDFALRHLMPEKAAEYIAKVLIKYSKLNGTKVENPNIKNGETYGTPSEDHKYVNVKKINYFKYDVDYREWFYYKIGFPIYGAILKIQQQMGWEIGLVRYAKMIYVITGRWGLRFKNYYRKKNKLIKDVDRWGDL